MGTIAFGAAIIAVVQFVRATVKYLEAQSKGQTNAFQKAMFCCVQCCLKCVQYCLEKLSKNAFVWTAVYGTPFLPSAFAAFALLWQNLVRVAAISVVSEYLLVLGKGLVAILTAGIGNYLLTNTDVKNEISSTFVPLIAIFLLAYLVASLFMVLYDTAIETMFLCLLIDEEANMASGQMFAPKSLQDLVAKYEPQSREEAERIKGKPIPESDPQQQV